MEATNRITITIKILHYTTNNLRVERNISVVQLKHNIYFYIGVPVERQYRLLFRGRALQDDQRLSDYHVEEGHTIYLVDRQPIAQGIFNHSYQLTARRNGAPSILIPDSFTTLSLHLNRLRQQFATYGNNANNVQTSSRSREDRIARESHWPELAHTTRQLLTGEVAESLSNISAMLVNQVNVTEPSARRLLQDRVVDSGRLLSNLGSSLLALGRATSRFGMGDTLEDVSRELFMSTSGQNRVLSHHSWLQPSIEAGMSIRATSLTRSVRNQQEFLIVITESGNADNNSSTSSPQLTTEEVLGDSDSET